MPETKEVEVKNYEVMVDFEGTKTSDTPKMLIPEDAYQAEFVSASLVEVPAYKQEGVTEKKVVFQVQLSGEGSDNALLPLYANPIVKKSGTKGYSNSKLYDLLEKADELENAKKQHDALETYEGLVGFFDAALKGRKCKALVKIRNRGTDNAYSTIGSIVRFEPKVPSQGVAPAQ